MGRFLKMKKRALQLGRTSSKFVVPALADRGLDYSSITFHHRLPAKAGTTNKNIFLLVAGYDLPKNFCTPRWQSGVSRAIAFISTPARKACAKVMPSV